MPRQTLTVQLMHANARIAQLEAEVLRLEGVAVEACARFNDLAAKQPSGRAAKPMPVEFDAYWDYVRAAKKWCYANNKPVSYASTEQFAEAHGVHSY